MWVGIIIIALKPPLIRPTPKHAEGLKAFGTMAKPEPAGRGGQIKPWSPDHVEFIATSCCQSNLISSLRSASPFDASRALTPLATRFAASGLTHPGHPSGFLTLFMEGRKPFRERDF